MKFTVDHSSKLRAFGAGLCAAAALFADACSNDGPRSDPSNPHLEELTADQGVSFRLPHRVVPAGREEQSCYFVRVPDLNNGQDFFVNRVLAATTIGTHHLNLFRVRTIIGLKPEDGEPVMLGKWAGTVVHGHDDYRNSECWKSANWADWPLMGNTQSPVDDGPYTDWKLPPNVAIRMTPGELIMIQSHYVNTTVQPAPYGAKVGINLYRSTDPNPMELGSLFATQQSLRICQSNPNPVYSGTCRLPGAPTIIAANGHFHSRGKEFEIFRWDGRTVDHPPMTERFYISREWDHPPMTTGLDIKVAESGGIWWNCAYQWRQPLDGCDEVNQKDPQQQGDCCYVFGGNTDVGEHCNVFLYYYPKLADGDVFCN